MIVASAKEVPPPPAHGPVDAHRRKGIDLDVVTVVSQSRPLRRHFGSHPSDVIGDVAFTSHA
jgi:hypothetical protein